MCPHCSFLNAHGAAGMTGVVVASDSLGNVPLLRTGGQTTAEPNMASESSSTSLSTPNLASATSKDTSFWITLPEEILVIILEDVITSESLSCRCQSKDANSRMLSPPRKLAQVSRAWRDVVFSCPALWSHIHLTPFQSVRALKEHLSHSSPLPIYIVVHQWPFRSPIAASGPQSITTLTAQLHSILSPTDTDSVPACSRVQSITVNATESSTFINFVLQTLTGRGSKFPALRRVSMNGNLRATWSRACFFDGKNAPALETLELTNTMISYDAHRLPWGTGLNLTTLVWSAPTQKDGSLTISAMLFHHIVSSFPSLTTLEVRGEVLSLHTAAPSSLTNSGVTPLSHIKVLKVTGHTFTSASTAFTLLFFFPSLKRLAVQGRCCTGPVPSRTIEHTINAFIQYPVMLSNLEELDIVCVDLPCARCSKWISEELERWKWRRSTSEDHQGRSCSIPRVWTGVVTDETFELYSTEEDRMKWVQLI